MLHTEEIYWWKINHPGLIPEVFSKSVCVCESLFVLGFCLCEFGFFIHKLVLNFHRNSNIHNILKSVQYMVLQQFASVLYYIFSLENF